MDRSPHQPTNSFQRNKTNPAINLPCFNANRRRCSWSTLGELHCDVTDFRSAKLRLLRSNSSLRWPDSVRPFARRPEVCFMHETNAHTNCDTLTPDEKCSLVINILTFDCCRCSGGWWCCCCSVPGFQNWANQQHPALVRD